MTMKTNIEDLEVGDSLYVYPGARPGVVEKVTKTRLQVRVNGELVAFHRVARTRKVTSNWGPNKVETLARPGESVGSGIRYIRLADVKSLQGRIETALRVLGEARVEALAPDVMTRLANTLEDLVELKGVRR